MIARKRLVFALVAALTPLLLVAAAIVWIESEAGERWVERSASRATEREVTIGELDIKIGWQPGVRVSALRVANPEWAKSEHLAQVGTLEARFRLLPLIVGRGVIEDLTLVEARLGLEREEHRNTWTLAREDKEDDRPLPVVVRRINVDRGHVAYRDTTIDTDLQIEVAGDVGAGGVLDLTGRGTFRGQKTQAVARIPALLPTKDTPVEMSAAATIGDITAAAAGTVRAADVDGVDLEIEVSGASLADLKRLFPINLPNTPPYRLQGRFRNPREAFVFDPFVGRVGDSDLSGGASYSRGGKRPVLKAKLTSNLLDFDDLGPLVGAPSKTGPGETAAPEQRRQVKKIQQTGKVLPQRRFAVEDWPIMDADVRFEGRRIVDAAQVPIENLSANWILEDGVLRFEPLRFAIAGGRVTAKLSVDSNRKPVLGKANIELNALDLNRLFPERGGPMKSPLGTLYGRIDIAGKGASIAELFGTADGRLALVVNGGRVSNLLVEVAGLDVAEALRILATRDVDVQLRCAVADLTIQSGVASPRVLVIDTTDTVVTGSGTIDFRAEQLNLVSHAEPKDRSPFVLRSPMRIQGTFKDPNVRPQAAPIVVRGAAGLLLGLVNPLLAVVPFIETGPGEDSDCGALLRQVKSAGIKPAPAKTTK